MNSAIPFTAAPIFFDYPRPGIFAELKLRFNDFNVVNLDKAVKMSSISFPNKPVEERSRTFNPGRFLTIVTIGGMHSLFSFIYENCSVFRFLKLRTFLSIVWKITEKSMFLLTITGFLICSFLRLLAASLSKKLLERLRIANYPI